MANQSETILLIDADAMMYSSCFANKDSGEKYEVDLEEVEFKFSDKLFSIENSLEEQYNGHFNVVRRVLFFEGAGNFRKFINPKYKINRKDKEIPPLLNPLKAAVQSKKSWLDMYYPFPSYNVETDDTIAATYKKWCDKGYEIIICSLDKDMKTIPCLLYDYYYTRNELVHVSEEDAMHNFFIQMLEGDSTDGVSGVSGLGRKKSKKILSNCSSRFGYIKATYKEYLRVYKKNAKHKYIENYNMLKIVEDGVYTPEIEGVLF